jgi:hypothetical protein
MPLTSQVRATAKSCLNAATKREDENMNAEKTENRLVADMQTDDVIKPNHGVSMSEKLKSPPVYAEGPDLTLSDAIREYHASVEMFEAIEHHDDAALNADADKLVMPPLKVLEQWERPAENLAEVLAALEMVQGQLVDFDAPAVCLPLVSSALKFLRNQPSHRPAPTADISEVYWRTREALGMVKLIQKALDAFLEDDSIPVEKVGDLRDIEQAAAVSVRVLNQGLKELDELERVL